MLTGKGYQSQVTLLDDCQIVIYEKDFFKELSERERQVLKAIAEEKMRVEHEHNKEEAQKINKSGKRTVSFFSSSIWPFAYWLFGVC